MKFKILLENSYKKTHYFFQKNSYAKFNKHLQYLQEYFKKKIFRMKIIIKYEKIRIRINLTK